MIASNYYGKFNAELWGETVALKGYVKAALIAPERLLRGGKREVIV
jgi:hypothetical protein